MSIKEKTLEQVEEKIENIERFISENGIGSGYLSKAEKIQRDVNLGIVVGGMLGILGVSAWFLLKKDS